MENTTLRTIPSVAALLTVLLASPAFATLIPIGPIPTSGAGLGAVNTIMTFQNSPSETGSVGWNGTTVTTTGDTTALNNVYTLSSLGTSSFSNIVLLFNGTEAQAPADQSIQLNSLSLVLYSANGLSSVSFSTAPGAVIYDAFPGVGTAGFGYRLDAAQAAQADAFLLANPDLRIGTSASASLSSGGPETISISTLPAQSVPDSGATVALVGLALIGLGTARRFLR